MTVFICHKPSAFAFIVYISIKFTVQLFLPILEAFLLCVLQRLTSRSQPLDICGKIIDRSGWMYRYVDHATALHMASITGDRQLCQVLVGAGADLDSYTSRPEQKTPLHFAVELLHVDIVELLVEAGADVNAPVVLTRCTNDDFDDDSDTREREVYHASPVHLVRTVLH